MVLVKVDCEHESEIEKALIKVLERSLKKDLIGVECHRCDKESYVSVHIRKNKLTGLTTHIQACCPEFKRKIEKILLLEEHLG